MSGLVAEADIEEGNRRLEAIGIDRPLKDGLEFEELAPKDVAVPGDITSEEETELDGPKRPKHG